MALGGVRELARERSGNGAPATFDELISRCTRLARVLRSGLHSAPVLAVTLAFAAHAAEPMPPGPELPPEARLRSVSFVGGNAVSKRELRNVVRAQPRSWWRIWRSRPEFSQARVDEDAERLERFYRERGYYEAQVEVRVTAADGGMLRDVRYEIDERAPVRLVAVEVILTPQRGLPPETAEEIAADLPLALGEPFALADYSEARAKVLERLADRARPDAELSGGARVDVATHEARVRWEIDPGPPVVFGETGIEGLTDVQEHVVRRELGYAEGKPYSARALEQARSRLLALRLFRYVGIQAQPAAPTDAQTLPAVWPVTVRLRERPPRSLGLGGGWQSDVGPQGRVSWSHRNFLGDGRRLRLEAAASRLEQSVGSRFLQPYLFGSRVTTLESDLSWVRRSRNAYDTNLVELLAGPRRRFGDSWVGEAAYRFGWTNVSNVRDETNEVQRAQQGSGLLSGPLTRWRREALDDARQPSRGTWLQLALGLNSSAFGSDFDWLRYEAEIRGFLPLGPSVAAARLRFRVIDPFGSTRADAVPLPERLYLGGVHTVRGFPFEKLGPLEEDGDPVGGTSSILASVEWRVPIWRQLGGTLFVDAGQVALEPWTFQVDDVGVGVGGGLSLATPLGPVAIYLGYPVRPLAVSREVRFALSVGHAF